MEMDKRIEEVEASNLERVLHSVAGAKAWMQSRGKWVPNTGAAKIAAMVMQ